MQGQMMHRILKNLKLFLRKNIHSLLTLIQIQTLPIGVGCEKSKVNLKWYAAHQNTHCAHWQLSLP